MFVVIITNWPFLRITSSFNCCPYALAKSACDVKKYKQDDLKLMPVLLSAVKVNAYRDRKVA